MVLEGEHRSDMLGGGGGVCMWGVEGIEPDAAVTLVFLSSCLPNDPLSVLLGCVGVAQMNDL